MVKSILCMNQHSTWKQIHGTYRNGARSGRLGSVLLLVMLQVHDTMVMPMMWWMIVLVAVVMLMMRDTCVDGHLMCRIGFFLDNRRLVGHADSDLREEVAVA